jgi:hypothetical protein
VRALDAACGASGALEQRGTVVVVVDERALKVTAIAERLEYLPWWIRVEWVPV